MKGLNKYCMILKIKPEHMKDYTELHKNAWEELLEAIEDSGASELIIFKWNNYSIVFFECEDLDEFYRVYGQKEVTIRWNDVSKDWFDDAPCLDGSDSVDNLEKIFDFKEQLANARKARADISEG